MKKHLLWLLVILLIGVRYFTTRPVYKNGDLIKISGPVLTDPRIFQNSQYIKLSGLRVYLPEYPQIKYGDIISVSGVVKDGKLGKAELIDIDQGRVMASGFRNSLISFYQRNLPEPEAGLLGGIMLGNKGAVLPHFYEQAKFLGVAHVVVASGTNITFVASFLMGVAVIFLSRRKAIFFVILGIILYLFVAGFEAPLIRAAIMSTFIFLGEEMGKIVSKWRIFFLTVGVMLIVNPLWLGDIGIILSFVSTASLMIFEKRIRAMMPKIPSILKESLSTSLAAQIGVAPVLFLTFGRFSLLSPVINALVLWIVPVVMVIGAAAGTIGLVFEPLGRILLYLTYPMLWWFTRIVQIFSK